MYTAKSRTTTKNVLRSKIDILREQRKWNHVKAQLIPEKAEKIKKKKRKTEKKQKTRTMNRK